MEHGAAFRSGAVHAGDRLLKVDGVPTSKMNLDELAARLKGPVGSHVTLVLQAAHTSEDQESAAGGVRMTTLLRSALVTKRAAGGAQTELSYADMNARVDKVVEMMQTAVTPESARSMLEKSHWSVEHAVINCRVLPHSQAMSCMP